MLFCTNLYYFAIVSFIIIEIGESPQAKKPKGNSWKGSVHEGHQAFRTELDNPQITVSGEAKVVIKNRGGEPEEKEGESKSPRTQDRIGGEQLRAKALITWAYQQVFLTTLALQMNYIPNPLLGMWS